MGEGRVRGKHFNGLYASSGWGWGELCHIVSLPTGVRINAARRGDHRAGGKWGGRGLLSRIIFSYAACFAGVGWVHGLAHRFSWLVDQFGTHLTHPFRGCVAPWFLVLRL